MMVRSSTQDLDAIYGNEYDRCLTTGVFLTHARSLETNGKILQETILLQL